MEHSFDIKIAKEYGIETRPQAEIDELVKEWGMNN